MPKDCRLPTSTYFLRSICRTRSEHASTLEKRPRVDEKKSLGYCRQMSSKTGPERMELERTLMSLGIRPSSYRALMLLPLIYVAWADGKMESVEVDHIRRFARERLHMTADTIAVLDNWLREAPSQAYVEAGLQGLLGVALDEDFLEVEVSELSDLLLHAERIARATADALDDPTAVTPEEEDALGEIARLLEIDGGTTWKQVLESLRTNYPPKP
jgi:hypothetical protein